MEYKIADDRYCSFLLKCDPKEYAASYSASYSASYLEFLDLISARKRGSFPEALQC
ncbi:hypothetical protein [Methanosarcina sp. Kolksee]|uniref:hypothetical protein n=1 Tax=Methanosarcina sp. Kolksee TaxID=1434099 RepID=UPI000AA06D46|nr:hypothetical protein [Methanosarcina sp. Kolksee]